MMKLRRNPNYLLDGFDFYKPSLEGEKMMEILKAFIDNPNACNTASAKKATMHKERANGSRT